MEVSGFVGTFDKLKRSGQVTAGCVFLALAGCASGPELAQSGPVARIRFWAPDAEDNPDMVVDLYTYQNEACRGAQRIVALGEKKPALENLIPLQKTIALADRSIGMLRNPSIAYDPATYVEIQLGADRRIYASMSATVWRARCAVTFSFLAFADRQYEVKYKIHDNFRATDSLCEISVSELQKEGETINAIKIDSLQKASKPCGG